DPGHAAVEQDPVRDVALAQGARDAPPRPADADSAHDRPGAASHPANARADGCPCRPAASTVARLTKAEPRRTAGGKTKRTRSIFFKKEYSSLYFLCVLRGKGPR